MSPHPSTMVNLSGLGLSFASVFALSDETWTCQRVGGSLGLPRVTKIAVQVKYWWPAVLWMAIIFIASMDPFSGTHTSRILVPILRWFNPEITPETIGFIQLIVRKCAHLAEYAILALLVLRALRRSRCVTEWSWCLARWAWVIASVYAVTDEFHQTFVDSRMGSPMDVLIDSVGAALGVWACWLIGRWRKKW